MPEIKFSREEKSILVDRLKKYFDDELHLDIGQFDCEFLLDFFSAEMGSYYYNRGVSDAQALVLGKMEDLTDAFYEIEQPTGFTGK